MMTEACQHKNVRDETSIRTITAFDGLYDNGEDYFTFDVTSWVTYCIDCGEVIDAGEDGY